MFRSSYYGFAMLQPTSEYETKLEGFVRRTSSFAAYYVDEISDDLVLMEGLIVFSKKVTVWEASTILEGFTVRLLNDYDVKISEILMMPQARTINKHPAISVRVDLRAQFDDEAGETDDSDHTV